VWVSIGGYVSDSIWYTPDGGLNWHQRTGSGASALPAANVNTITLHPQNSDWVYVGTDLGIFVSEDKGLTWNTTPRFPNQNPFPSDGPVNVEVDHLFWLDDEFLLAATHGRGMFRTRLLVIVHVDWRNEGGLEIGTLDHPYGTVTEGFIAAGNGSTISIALGDYDEVAPADPPFVMQKRVKLVKPAGLEGSVVIR
jgi:hypothetical protein